MSWQNQTFARRNTKKGRTMEFGIVILLLIVGYFAMQVVIGYKQETRSEPTKKPRQAGDTKWPGKGNFDFAIVGESHYQDALKRLAGNHGDRSPDIEATASLIPESSNPYDKNAIRVELNGATVGYFSREDAPRFRRRLGGKGLTGSTTSCQAIINGGYKKRDGTRASYGVQLDIKPFD
jgi:hypothetical protein